MGRRRAKFRMALAKYFKAKCVDFLLTGPVTGQLNKTKWQIGSHPQKRIGLLSFLSQIAWSRPCLRFLSRNFHISSKRGSWNTINLVKLFWYFIQIFIDVCLPGPSTKDKHSNFPPSHWGNGTIGCEGIFRLANYLPNVHISVLQYQ